MGLIKAIGGAVGGVMADQWREYFYCDSMPVDILVRKGQKRVGGRSSNTKGEDNIISKGSIISVADGQCMAIVEQGKVVELSAVPGEFVFDSSTEPSIFAGDLGSSILDTFKTIGKRFTFGGDTAKDQRVYYFNTKELVGNKYGTPSPVPFRVVDQRAGIDIDIGIRCFGEYSYHLCNPILFYTNVCGNVAQDYNRSEIDSQLKSELLTALQPAFARISEMGIRYSALPGHTTELAEALNKELSAKWHDLRGIEIVSFGVSSVKANEDDEQMIKEMQRNAAFMDPTRAAAHLVGAQAAAMPRYGVYGHEYGRQRRRHEHSEPLRHGSAAGGTAARTRTGKRLDLRLRKCGFRQLLPQLRSEKARTETRRGRMEMQLRSHRKRQILPGMRQAEAR